MPPPTWDCKQVQDTEVVPTQGQAWSLVHPITSPRARAQSCSSIYFPTLLTVWCNVEAHEPLLNEQVNKRMNKWTHSLFLHLWFVETAFLTLETILFCCSLSHFLCVLWHCNAQPPSHPTFKPCLKFLCWGQVQKHFLKNTPTLDQLKSTHRGMAWRSVGGNWCLFMHLWCERFITCFILI